MMARFFAWAVVLTVCAGIWHYGGAYSSPWGKLTASPVLSHLPAAGDGCGKACE